MSKTVVFDIDGCLADFIGPAVKKGYELAGRPEPTGWVQQGWDDYGGLDKQEVQKLWHWIKGHPNFWSDLSSLATDEELHAIYRLHADHHRVYFATNRRLPEAAYYTREWAYDHGLGDIPVVITKRKGEFCRVVDADYYIDDKSENVDCAIWMTDGKTKAYVRDSVTNRGQYAPHSSKARRVSTIAEYLEDIKNGV